MHKKDLIAKLEQFVATYGTTGQVGWPGQKTFAKFLIMYLTGLKIPHDEKYDSWEIEPYLPELMVEAFEHLRTGADQMTVRFRQMYETETGYEVPNITDLGASSMSEQSSAVQTTLGFMLRDVTGLEGIEKAIDTYCNAQKYVLQQTFDKFLRLVYRRGMFEMVDKCEMKGMTGKFGKTELRTFVMAGRVMFTFARRKRGRSIYRGFGGEEIARLPYQEDSVSFVGEDGDPFCWSAGIQSVYADLKTALDMIEEVISNWPADAKERTKLYKASSSVSIL